MIRLLLYLLLCASLQGREIIINFINPAPDSPRDVYLIGEKVKVALELPKRNFTRRIKIPSGNQTLYFVKELPTEEKPIPLESPKVLIPEGHKSAAIFLLYDKENNVLPMKPLVINTSTAKFKAGQSLVCNFSPYGVTGKLGDVALKVAPYKRRIVGSSRFGTGTYETHINFTRTGETETHPLFKGYWRHYPEHRQFIIITKKEAFDKPHIHSLLDYVKQPVAEKK